MERLMFNAAREEAVRVTTIPDGCADIARIIGLAPENTIWDFGRIYSADSGMRDPDPAMGAYNQALTSLIHGAATGITLKLHDGFLDYQREYLGVSNIIELTRAHPPANQYLYPEHSLPAQLVRIAREEHSLRGLFRNKVYCGWLPVSDVQFAAEEVGARTLISADETLLFNSKAYFVRSAKEGGYNVAPYVVANDWESLDRKMSELAASAKSLGLDPDETTYWIKLDRLSSGVGVRRYEPRKGSFQSIKGWIEDTLKRLSRSRGDFMPVVMDIDIGALPWVKRVVSNVNIQGVIGAEGPVITGVTFQKVSTAGRYLGGSLALTQEDEVSATEAPKWAWPALQSAHRAGYRGYAGVDLLLCEDHDGWLRGCNLELNARLNGSTFLLSVAQRVGREAGLRGQALGFDFSCAFEPVASFKGFNEAFDGVMYRGARSGYAGIIPLLMKSDMRGSICGAKVIVVAPEVKGLKALEERLRCQSTK